MCAKGSGPACDGLSWDMLAAATATAAGFFSARLDPPSSWAARYLNSRGLRPQHWRGWGIGYAPGGWTALTGHLRGLGFPDDALLAAGLARRTAQGRLADVFRDRVMFPVRTADGIVAGFIGRARPATRTGPAENRTRPPPVYLNTGSTSLYRKSELLFGLFETRQALAAGAVPVLVEGPFDAVAVSVSAPGRFAGLAPCGTALTAAQVALLAEVADLAAAGIVVAFDGDQPGQAAAVRAYDLLRDIHAVRAVPLPAGQDPAGYLRAYGQRRLAGLLSAQQHPLADLVVDATTDEFTRWLAYPEGIYNALRATANTIARLPPHDVARQVIRTARRLGLRHEEVTEALISAVTQTEQDTSLPVSEVIRAQCVQCDETWQGAVA